MRLHKRNQHVGITSEHGLPGIDEYGRIQYYKLGERKDFYLFQNTTGTYLIYLDREKLDKVKQKLGIERQIVDIRGRERQYGNHSGYALELFNDGKNWLHASSQKKLQGILAKVQDSVVGNL